MRILDQGRCSVSNLNRHMLTEQLGPVLVVREWEKEGKGEQIITPPGLHVWCYVKDGGKQ